MKRVSITLVAILVALVAGVNATDLSVPAHSGHKVTSGVGFGIPYGVIGVNMDINLVEQLDLSAGFGSTVLAGMGYNVGLKYHLASARAGFRPRLAAYYGTNAVVQVEPQSTAYNGYYYSSKSSSGTGFAAAYPRANTTEGESYTGLSLGFGAQWMWGQSKSNGLDFDIMYIATTGYNVDDFAAQGLEIAEPGRIKFSIGYRHAF